MPRDFIAIIDFGSQYTHLIAKRFRQLKVYTQVLSPSTSINSLDKLKNAKGIILSGGPNSVYQNNSPQYSTALFDLNLPILGLCYGHQLTASHFGGNVSSSKHGEYGKAKISIIKSTKGIKTTKGTKDNDLFESLGGQFTVWMSHSDNVDNITEQFDIIAKTDSCPYAALKHKTKPIYTLQFHPEVKDTENGLTILANFAKITGIEKSWTMEQFLADEHLKIVEQSKDKNVLMFLSGGVDSSVAFSMLSSILGNDRVLGVYINNGFMRLGESEQIMQSYHDAGYNNVKQLEAENDFLIAVKGVVDPQEKRKIIGAVFINMRDKFLKSLDLNPNEWLLGQGTLYPDIIESGGSEHSNVIKSHHNRVQEVFDLMAKGFVVEPLKELYKDEVRQLGTLLKLPNSIINRHPFPGPGLAINVLCNDDSNLDTDNLISADDYKVLAKITGDKGYQASVLPVKSVGVQGDKRSYTNPVLLWGKQDFVILESLSTQITNQLTSINRVVYLLGADKPQLFELKKAYLSKDRLDTLRQADHLATQALIDNNLMDVIFQLLVITLPLGYGDKTESIVLRAVVSEDVMTARFAKIDFNILNPLVQKILKLPNIACVLYDVTHKPPATFGWE